MSVNQQPGGAPSRSRRYQCYQCKVFVQTAVQLKEHLLRCNLKWAENGRTLVTLVNAEATSVTSLQGQTVGQQLYSMPVVTPEVMEVIEPRRPPLEQLLDLHRPRQPAIGLEYVFEYYKGLNSFWYTCTLCDCESGFNAMFWHVLSFKHRSAYLTTLNLDMAPLLSLGRKKRALKLKEMAAEVEAMYGRQKILFVEDSTLLKRKHYLDRSQLNKNPRVDFVSNECYMESAPAPFLASVGPAPSFPIQAWQTPPAELKQTKTNVDDFGSNEELFEYLNQFQILCEDDAAFLLEVTRNFTRSLLQYRLKSTATQQAAVAPRDNYTMWQNSTASSIGQHMYMEYPPKNMSGQHAHVPTTSTYQTGANGSIMVTKPVSDTPISAYNFTPASFSAGPSPEGVVPAQESPWAVQGGSYQTKNMPPPISEYACYRCNRFGHDINHCPTHLLPYQAVNLAKANASDDNKIEDVQRQSGLQKDPVNVPKNTVPADPRYRCYRCGIPGHYIKHCPTNGDANFKSFNKMKRSTGIPICFTVQVDDPSMKGAMLTSSGKYVIQTIDAEVYAKETTG